MTSLETARLLANDSIVEGGWGGIPRELQRLLSLIGYGITGGVCGRSLTEGKIIFTGRQTCSLYLVLWIIDAGLLMPVPHPGHSVIIFPPYPPGTHSYHRQGLGLATASKPRHPAGGERPHFPQLPARARRAAQPANTVLPQLHHIHLLRWVGACPLLCLKFRKGGFRRRDTARGHPSNPPSRCSATPKPPLY